MTNRTKPASSRRPALLCFDGSDNASTAIAQASGLLGSHAAVLLTVWEPVAVWEPYDPGAIISAGVSRLASDALGLDEIAKDLARATMERGVEAARAAGFEVRGRLARGKTWKAICDTADAVDAAPIVLGARGLSRVNSVLLGSVSSAVLAHARRAVLVIPANHAEHRGGRAE